VQTGGRAGELGQGDCHHCPSIAEVTGNHDVRSTGEESDVIRALPRSVNKGGIGWVQTVSGKGIGSGWTQTGVKAHG